MSVICCSSRMTLCKHTKLWCRHYQNLLWCIGIIVALMPLPVAFNGDQKACIAYTILIFTAGIISGSIPFGVLGFMVVIFLPAMGVCSFREACTSFWKSALDVVYGMLVLSHAVEAVELHRRISLTLLRSAGPNHRRLLWTFGFLAFSLSLMATNIAVITILMPTLIEVLKNLRQQELNGRTFLSEKGKHISYRVTSEMGKGITVEGFEMSEEKDVEILKSQAAITETFNLIAPNDKDTTRLGKSAALAIFYGACIGGMAFLVGSGQNAILDGVVARYYETKGIDISPLDFVSWFTMVGPFSACFSFLGLVWLHILHFGIRSKKQTTVTDGSRIEKFNMWIDDELQKLGPMKSSEKVVIGLLSTLFLLLFFNRPGFMPGWSSLAVFKQGYIGNSTVILMISSFVYLIPRQLLPYSKETSSNDVILDWQTMSNKMNWGIILLIGGANVIGDQALASGLDTLIADKLSFLEAMPLSVAVLVICISITFMTEVIPNGIMVYVLVPIVGELAVKQDYNPLFLMLPVGLAAQCSFMLRTNLMMIITISYGTCTAIDFIKAGFVVNLLGALLTALFVNTWFHLVIDERDIPWLNNTLSISDYNITMLFNTSYGL